MKMGKNLAVLAVVPVSLLSLASCESEPKKPAVQTTQKVTMERGVPGGTVVVTKTAEATVDYVRSRDREVTLMMADGTKQMVKCGPEVRNYDQLREGDKVTITYTQERQVFMAPGSEPADDVRATGTYRAPEGAMPAASAFSVVQVTATVTAIDMAKHTATLTFSDGTSATIAVRPDVDLSQRKVGDQVVVRAMEGTAISVQRR